MDTFYILYTSFVYLYIVYMSIYTKTFILSKIFIYAIIFLSSHKIQEIYYINVDSDKKGTVIL